MVAEVANTTIDVLRGTSYNADGDVVDTANVAFSAIPACLVETGQSTQDTTSETPRTIRLIKLVVSPYVGLLNTDRIYDRSTGNTYSIMEVTQPPTLMGAPTDTTAKLKRVTATTT